jgi:hypothetical protein
VLLLTKTIVDAICGDAVVKFAGAKNNSSRKYKAKLLIEHKRLGWSFRSDKVDRGHMKRLNRSAGSSVGHSKSLPNGGWFHPR